MADITTSSSPGTSKVSKLAAEAEKMEAAVVATTSGMSSLGSIGAGVLAIIGLCGLAPFYMASIAAIVLGGSLIMSGLGITAEYKMLISSTAGKDFEWLGGGLTIELLGGVAALVLGILALIGMESMLLLSVDAIALGVVLFFSSSAMARLNNLKIASSGVDESAHKFAYAVVASSLDTQVVIGGAATVLGILAVIGIRPMLLVLIAFLCVGAALAFSGAALTGRMFGAASGVGKKSR